MSTNESELAAPVTDEVGAETPAVVLYIAKDGFAIDPDTGEVLGMVDGVGRLVPEEEHRERFAVRTLADAEWVLEMMLDEEGQIAGLKAKLAAIMANIDGQTRAHMNRLAYLHNRFAADLQAYAAEKIAGTKDRSVKTAFGTLAFRKTPGSIKPIDVTAALEWAQSHAPEAIKTEPKLLVSQLKGREDELPRDIFEVEGPGENFSVKTGLDAAAATGVQKGDG